MGRNPKPWRRGKGAWYAWIRGRSTWLAPATASHAEAKKALSERQNQPEVGAVDPSNVLVGDLIALFAADFRRRVSSGEAREKTWAVYHRFLKSATDRLGKMRWDAITNADVDAWVRSVPTWNSTTRHHAITALRAVANWSRRMTYVTTDPIKGCPRPKALKREHGLTPDQCDLIRSKINDQEFRDLFDFLRETGARVSEATTLTADRVDFGQHVCTVICKQTSKSGATRPVYLTEAAEAILRRLVERRPEGALFRNTRGAPWVPTHVAWRFTDLGKKCGISKGCHAHSLRGTFTDTHLMAGVPAPVVAEYLGHTTPKMTLAHYSRIASRGPELLRYLRPVKAIPSATPGDASEPPTSPSPSGN